MPAVLLRCCLGSCDELRSLDVDPAVGLAQPQQLCCALAVKQAHICLVHRAPSVLAMCLECILAADIYMILLPDDDNYSINVAWRLQQALAETVSILVHF